MNIQKTQYGFSDDELKTLPTVYRAGLFAGKTVVVSGAGSGLGKAIACLFARLGANVAICGRNEEKLAAATAFLQGTGATIFSRPMTIRDPEQVDKFVEAVWERFGALDVLVNNAGGQFPQMALDFKVKGWNAVIDTNLNGTWYMMQSAARQWVDRKSPGAIVNIVADFLARHARHGAHLRGAGGRDLPLEVRRRGMGAPTHPGQLRCARRPRNQRLRALSARRIEDLSRVKPDAARGRRTRYRRSSRLSVGRQRQVHHRRSVDGGRRRTTLGRPLAAGTAGIFSGQTRVNDAAPVNTLRNSRPIIRRHATKFDQRRPALLSPRTRSAHGASQVAEVFGQS